MSKNKYLPRVLVVDDDRDMRELVATVLVGCSFEPITKENAEQALAALGEYGDKISVVVLDWNMPGKSGIDFLRDLKRGPHKLIPVIMLSGRSNPEDIDAGIQAGAYYYLPKPLDRALLCSLTRSAVQDYARYRSLQFALKDGATSALLMDTGTFHFRAPAEAESLSSWLAQACPDPDSARLGLFELFINAIEHGNLDISYESKSELIRSGLLIDEIRERLEWEEFRDRRVQVNFERTAGRVLYEITDQGSGFDFQQYLKLSPERALSSHGRGIAMANAICFDRIEYVEPGNVVRAEIFLSDNGRGEQAPGAAPAQTGDRESDIAEDRYARQEGTS